MNIISPRTIKAVLCRDLDEYANAAGPVITAGEPLLSVPILKGERTAARLADVFGALPLHETMTASSDPPAPLEILLQRLAGPAAAGDSDRVMLVDARTPDCIPAIFYGHATGRSVVLTHDMNGFATALRGAKSAILAGAAALFDKPFLKQLLDWCHTEPAAPRQVGIITGRDVVQIADLVAKSLLEHAAPASGQPDAATCPAYEMIGAHGNEIHLDYGNRVLCGRSPNVVAEREGGFDCGVGCPYADRLEADQITARCVLLVSCDAFTPTGGVASPMFSLLFRLLDGKARAVLAPYKHIQLNESVLMMVEAMARSGYALGEIAHAVNGRANIGTLPDYGYLVLGDPEFRAAPQSSTHPPQIAETSRGLLIRTEVGVNQHTLHLSVPTMTSDEPVSVLAISPNLRAPGIFFAMGAGTAASTWCVTVFSDTPLPAGPVEFSVIKTRRPPVSEIGLTGDRLNNLRIFRSVCGKVEAVAHSEKSVTDLLRMAVAFPRPIDAVIGQNVLLNFGPLMRAEFARLGGRLCDALYAELGRRRIWISQEYADLFAQVRRAGPQCDRACPYCLNHVTAWAYDDPLTGLASRHVLICDRCGIISDAPAESPLAIDFAAIKEFRRAAEDLEIKLHNAGETPLNVSLAVQLNEWQSAGLQGTHSRADLELAPKETRTHTATLHFPKTFQDDILSVQLFVVTESLDISFLSQKVVSIVRDV